MSNQMGVWIIPAPFKKKQNKIMTKKKLKKKIEEVFSLANMINTKVSGNMDSFRIVSTPLKDGGHFDWYYDLRENRLEWHTKDIHQAIRLKPREVPEKLSRILSNCDFVIKKYIWLGE